jgi:hypothetical protein
MQEGSYTQLPSILSADGSDADHGITIHDDLSLYVQYIRTSVLDLSPDEFCREIGCTDAQLDRLENPKGRGQAPKTKLYTAIIEYLQRRWVQEPGNQRILQAIHALSIALTVQHIQSIERYKWKHTLHPQDVYSIAQLQKEDKRRKKRSKMPDTQKALRDAVRQKTESGLPDASDPARRALIQQLINEPVDQPRAAILAARNRTREHYELSIQRRRENANKNKKKIRFQAPVLRSVVLPDLPSEAFIANILYDYIHSGAVPVGKKIYTVNSRIHLPRTLVGPMETGIKRILKEDLQTREIADIDMTDVVKRVYFDLVNTRYRGEAKRRKTKGYDPNK